MALIIASRALVDTSVQEVAALFFVKERGWYASDVAAYIGIFGLCGIFANTLFPLWASLRGAPSSTAVNLFSMTCNVLHVIAIGALEDKYLVMLATPLGTFSYIGFSACTAMISGESEDKTTTKSTDAQDDQGTLLGVVCLDRGEMRSCSPFLPAPSYSSCRSYALVSMPILVIKDSFETTRLQMSP